jgi:excisionase family DNA binding protein
MTKDNIEVIGMTKEQAAKSLGLSVSAIEELMRNGEIAYANIGRAVRFYPEDLHHFMRERTRRTPARTITRIMEAS